MILNSALEQRLYAIRSGLDSDGDSPLYGFLGPPLLPSASGEGLPPEYWAFLHLADGARCGDIDIADHETFSRIQFLATDLPGSRARWAVVGQIVYEPLVIDRKSGLVTLYSQDPPQKPQRRFRVGFADFLLRFAFGPGYAELVPTSEEDLWLTFLRSTGSA